MKTGEDAHDGERARSLRRLGAIVTALILVPAALLLLVYCVRSLGWRTEHDVPLAHYSAFMHAQYGTKPYAELFEISFPGTIVVHLGITRVFGYDDRGVMVANLLWFVALAGVTGSLMMRFGRVVAVASVALFGVAYFSYGRDMMLQRDGLLILPIAAALLIDDRGLWQLRARRVAIGLLVGLAAAVKPHAAVGLIPLVVSDIYRSGPARLWQRGFAVGWYALGFAVPCGLVFAWLVATGGFSAWLEMSREYLPLYLHLTGYHATIQGTARLRYLVEGALDIGGQLSWLPAAGAGVFMMRFGASPERTRLTRVLLAEAAVFAVYPVFAGQFWSYHYVPFVYFLALLSSLCLAILPEAATMTEVILPKVALVLALLTNAQITQSVRSLDHPTPVRRGEVDEMAQFLTARLRPGDTVQPLDWTGGAVHAMLIARARLATRFMYDYHFYHHVSQPFIQVLRGRFISELRQAQPRFVIEYFGPKKPWPMGKDTTRDFPELKEFLTAGYVVDVSAENYRIYERRPVTP